MVRQNSYFHKIFSKRYSCQIEWSRLSSTLISCNLTKRLDSISRESLAVRWSFAKRLTKARRKNLAHVLIKMIPRYHYDSNFRDNKKSDTILISRKNMEYFKTLDHPRNASKIDLSVSSKLVLAFITRISGTKIFLTLVKYLTI